MVYISQDGTIRETKPFSLSSIFGLFWGVLNFIYMFGYTLIQPGVSKVDPRYPVDYKRPGSGGSGGSNPRFRGFGPSGSPGAPPPPGCGCG